MNKWEEIKINGVTEYLRSQLSPLNQATFDIVIEIVDEMSLEYNTLSRKGNLDKIDESICKYCGSEMGIVIIKGKMIFKCFCEDGKNEG